MISEIGKQQAATDRKNSRRLKAKEKSRPIVQAAEDFICRGLGIVQDGEMVIEQAMQEFARRFQGEVPDHVLQAMRELFQEGSQENDDVDEALLSHGVRLAWSLEKTWLVMQLDRTCLSVDARAS
jgi:predicted NAD/FAD-dependent oxidoreductase